MNIIGKRFGKLIVLEEIDERKHGSKVYKCQCDCGNITHVARTNLRAKNGTKSCGCTHKISHNKTHGKTGTRLYRIWVNMKTRCYNKNRLQYNDWGGRGIGVCNEWKDDFMAFYKWAYDNGYNDSLSIDRIDVDGDYEPSNCRWATRKQQANNTRNNVLLTYNGKTQTMTQWAEELGVDNKTITRKRDLGHYFIIACLSRFFNIKWICKTFNVDMNNLLEKYHEERARYTDKEIESMLQEVYYCED